MLQMSAAKMLHEKISFLGFLINVEKLKSSNATKIMVSIRTIVNIIIVTIIINLMK
jgi:hypothetical protein